MLLSLDTMSLYVISCGYIRIHCLCIVFVDYNIYVYHILHIQMYSNVFFPDFLPVSITHTRRVILMHIDGDYSCS